MLLSGVAGKWCHFMFTEVFSIFMDMFKSLWLQSVKFLLKFLMKSM